MKKLLIITVIFALLCSLCACSDNKTQTDTQGLDIVTTVFPAYDFARQIAGECANVTLLVPPGTEIHSFEPTARDILTLQSCDLLICNGGESEAWLEELLDSLDEGIEVLRMMDCVDTLEEELKEGMQEEHDHEHHDDHEEAPEYDEHVWTSPVNAQRICRAIGERLSAVDGANAELYAANCEQYCAALSELDGAFRSAVSNGARDTLIFADRFPVRYFTEEYGLDYYAAFPGCADDTEPSSGTVAFLIDRVKADAVPAVLYIEFSDQKMADVICEDTSCRKLLFHSCHNVGADELQSGVSYLDLMWANVETVKEALG